MKLAKPPTTTLGAVALTLVAAGSALAVNIGIVSQNGDSGVGTLDALSAMPAVSQVSPQYVYVDLSDPSQLSTAAQPQATLAPATRVVDREEEYEGAEYDD
jgi:hypothetical protein